MGVVVGGSFGLRRPAAQVWLRGMDRQMAHTCLCDICQSDNFLRVHLETVLVPDGVVSLSFPSHCSFSEQSSCQFSCSSLKSIFCPPS